MSISENSMCAILLCTRIGIRKDDRTLKPFTQGEWEQLLDLLSERGMEPKELLAQDGTWAERLSLSPGEEERIRSLRRRSGAAALELYDLSRRGIKPVTTFDRGYPVLVKRNLKRKAPPVLFCAGNLSLAGKVGIAAAGSRDVDEDGRRFAASLAEKASAERLVVYTGGARGVDSIVEETAIRSGGAAVAFLADSLTLRLKRSGVINSLIDGKLLLLTDTKPDTGFSVARAMNRNKCVFSSAYGTFIVCSDCQKGGTWAGATEALRHGWSRVLVWDSPRYEGNQKLIQMGAVPYVLSDERLYDVMTKQTEKYEQENIFHWMGGSGGAENGAET